MAKNVLVGLSLLGLIGCATQTGVDLTRALFGYVEPPQAESVMQSLKREYTLCMNIDSSRNCSQIAYDRVRIIQGLDPKPLPTGYVRIIREEFSEDDDKKGPPNSEPQN